MKIYIAIEKKKNGKHGKLNQNFSVQTDPGDVFRALAESGEISKYDVACFDIKSIEPTKILLSEKSEYFRGNS
jgi:hypothetical protein